MKGVAWSEEEDKFLIYCLWKYGTKNTETIRAAIHMSPRWVEGGPGKRPGRSEVIDDQDILRSLLYFCPDTPVFGNST